MSNFTGRDLALLLPDKLDVRNAEGEADNFEPLKPKVDVTKRVIRYFPGKAPVWVGDDGMLYRLVAFVLIISVVGFCLLQFDVEQNWRATRFHIMLIIHSSDLSFHCHQKLLRYLLYEIFAI
jgi:hypothetical protein